MIAVRNSTRRFVFVALIAGLAAEPPRAMGDTAGGIELEEMGAALPISPGEVERESETAGPCPTFSWSPALRSTATELAIYELVDDSGKLSPRLIASTRFPGGASSWTPSRPNCFAPGGRYAWIVRASTGAGEDAAEWSEPLRFSIPEAPSRDEVAMAREVLRRWHEANPDEGGSVAATSPGAASPRRAGNSDSGIEESGSTMAPDGVGGTAAIRGEIAGSSGETYGVAGISNSAAGAGVAATNSANGADLRLDGSAASATDLAMKESGIDRSSSGTETFDIRNSGAGTMTLRVDGVDVVTTATDQNTTYLAGNQLALTAGSFDVEEGAGSGLDADLLDGEEAGAVGTINTPTNPVDWSKLKNVPAGLADGTDDGSIYLAGNQLELAGDTFNVLEGADSNLDADTLDGSDSTDFVSTGSLTWASLHRHFYLTVGTYTGTQTLSVPACATGYHFASLWEIYDVSSLVYLVDPSLSAASADAGSGPPSSVDGWIRTGGVGQGNGPSLPPGASNCAAWTLDTLDGFPVHGTTVSLTQNWGALTNDDGVADAVTRLTPWVATAGNPTCATPKRVWCVED